MVGITIAMCYGMVMGLMLGYGIGLYKDEIGELSLFERVVLALAIEFWPICLCWYFVTHYIIGKE